MDHSQKIPLRSGLEGLPISAQELDQITNLSFVDDLAIALAQAVSHKNSKQLLSVILTEVFILGVLLILLLPISFIVLRRFQFLPSLPNHPLHLTLVLIIGLAVLLWIVLLGNRMLWRRARSLRELAQLIHQTHQFNWLVDSLLLLSQEKHLPFSNSTNAPHHREEILTTLWSTRDTLISALNIEKLSRTQPSLVAYSDAVATLEHHLTTLMTLRLHMAIDDYTPLLDEILQININVHRELSRLER